MDVATYLRFLVVLILVIGLILGLAWILKRFGLSGALQGTLGRKRRLSAVESLTVDSRYRVVLVRRDDVEHLLLVGPNSSQVIERGIDAPPLEPGASADAVPTQGFAGFRQFLSKDNPS